MKARIPRHTSCRKPRFEDHSVVWGCWRYLIIITTGRVPVNPGTTAHVAEPAHEQAVHPRVGIIEQAYLRCRCYRAVPCAFIICGLVAASITHIRHDEPGDISSAAPEPLRLAHSFQYIVRHRSQRGGRRAPSSSQRLGERRAVHFDGRFDVQLKLLQQTTGARRRGFLLDEFLSIAVCVIRICAAGRALDLQRALCALRFDAVD